MPIRIRIGLALIAVTLAAPVAAQSLTDAERSQVDSAVKAVVDATGSPSASIAVVRDGQIVYEHAYGIPAMPDTAARSDQRYAIGSISKQFTASAILLLPRSGKLSLDDTVAQVAARPDAGERGHRPAVAVDDVGLSGLLAAGLRDARHDAAPTPASRS